MRGRGEMMVKSRLTAVCFVSMLVVMVTPWPILPHPTTDILAKFLPPNTTDEEPPIDYSEYYDNFSDVDIMDYHFILLNPDRKGAETDVKGAETDRKGAETDRKGAETDDRVEKRENPKGDIKSYEGVDERNERELTSEGERRKDKRQDRKVTGGNKRDEGEERSVGEHNNKRDEGKNKITTDKIKNQREKENKSHGEISRDNELQEREIIAGKNISGQLYDGDIEIDATLLKYILPEEDQMLSAINPTTLPELLWPEGPDGWPLIHYTYDEPYAYKDAVERGIAHWEEHTCLQFARHYYYNGPHIRFRDTSMCTSRVGRQTSPYGQHVGIGVKCTSLGIVVHEIGHALGLFHEHSRYDRDHYIHINLQNIDPFRCEGTVCYRNFLPIHPINMSLFNIPYDFSSIMHYSSRAFSSNGRVTLASKDPFYQGTMGQRLQLSHRDKHLVNILYGCVDRWVKRCHLTKNPCQGESYLGRGCVCVCPPGTRGRYCQHTLAGYYEQQMAQSNKVITRPTIITTPNYRQIPIRNVTAGTWCVFVIRGPGCSVPVLTFYKFHLHRQEEDKGECSSDFLEIRQENNYDGPVYCGRALEGGRQVVGMGRQVQLYFHAKTDLSRGFWAKVKFKIIPHCPIKTSSDTSDKDTKLHQQYVATEKSGPCTVQKVEDASSSILWRSPHYPRPYPPNIACTLTLRQVVPAGVQLQVVSFSLAAPTNYSHCGDFVHVHLTNRKVERLCGSILPSTTLELPTAGSTFHFNTDGLGSSMGFELHIQLLYTHCNQVLNVDPGHPYVSHTISKETGAHGRAFCQLWCQATQKGRVEVGVEVAGSLDCEQGWVSVSLTGDLTFRDAIVLCDNQERQCPSTPSHPEESDPTTSRQNQQNNLLHDLQKPGCSSSQGKYRLQANSTGNMAAVAISTEISTERSLKVHCRYHAVDE